MSMFMVGKTHVDVLTTILLRSEAVPEIGGLSPDLIGLGLWLENWNSGKYRYPQAWGEVPSETLGHVQAYRYEPVDLSSGPDAAAAYAVAVRCYQYQSCEHPTWTRSPAYRWTEQLMAVLGEPLPVEDGAELNLWPVPSRESWAVTVAQLDRAAA